MSVLNVTVICIELFHQKARSFLEISLENTFLDLSLQMVFFALPKIVTKCDEDVEILSL